MQKKQNSFYQRRNRIRVKLKKISNRQRLSIFKSRKYIYAQIIDDNKNLTIVTASSLEKVIKQKQKSNCNIKSAIAVGKLLAQRAVEKSVKYVQFDKSGYKYHGIIKALADEARKQLEF